MTTPPTPADWYPDPDDSAGLRYWDGTSWTEHRAPAPAPAELQQEPVQPYDTHPPVSTTPPVEPSVEPESVPWDAPMPAWDSPTQSVPTSQAPVEPPPFEPPAEPPSYEPAQFAPPPGPPPGPYGQPTGPSGPSGEGPNKKLVVGILGGALVILLVILVVITVVIMRKGEPTVTSAQNTTQSSTTSSATTTSETESSSSSAAPTPPPTDAEATDGDYAFSVAGTETGDTITSTVSDSVQTTADGMYLVVYLNVRNIGPDPLTFVATFQQLNAAGQTFPLDDEATAFLGGTIAQIAPGDQVETPLVYDVPVGTEADSILVRADPASPGAELPLR